MRRTTLICMALVVLTGCGAQPSPPAAPSSLAPVVTTSAATSITRTPPRQPDPSDTCLQQSLDATGVVLDAMDQERAGDRALIEVTSRGEVPSSEMLTAQIAAGPQTIDVMKAQLAYIKGIGPCPAVKANAAFELTGKLLKDDATTSFDAFITYGTNSLMRQTIAKLDTWDQMYAQWKVLAQ